MVYYLILFLAGGFAIAASNSTLTERPTGQPRVLTTGCNTHFDYDLSNFMVSKTNLRSVLFDSHIFVLSTTTSKDARIHKFGLNGSSVGLVWISDLPGENDSLALSVTSNGKIIAKVYTLFRGQHYEVIFVINA